MAECDVFSCHEILSELWTYWLLTPPWFSCKHCKKVCNLNPCRVEKYGLPGKRTLSQKRFLISRFWVAGWMQFSNNHAYVFTHPIQYFRLYSNTKADSYFWFVLFVIFFLLIFLVNVCEMSESWAFFLYFIFGSQYFQLYKNGKEHHPDIVCETVEVWHFRWKTEMFFLIVCFFTIS